MSLCKNKLHQSQSTEIIGKVLDINKLLGIRYITFPLNYPRNALFIYNR